MARFFSISTTKVAINLDHVTRVFLSRDRDTGETTIRYYDSNDTLIGDDTTILDPPDFNLVTAPIVPASPGERALFLSVGTNGPRPTKADIYACEYQIVAWRITPYGAEPVIPDDENTNGLLIKLPDGRWIDPGNRIFESLMEAAAQRLKDAQDDWDKTHHPAAATQK